jgi:NTE family protein
MVPKVAVACQGGGMHAAFEVGVLTEILKHQSEQKKFDVVGLSGTSAGALCAMMVWYGLIKKENGKDGSEISAIQKLNDFWDQFVAKTPAETALNMFTFGALRAEETEIPVLGINAPILGINPYGAIYKAFAACLPRVGVRRQYFDLVEMLTNDCPDFGRIDWPNIKKRVLIGASEVVNGFETVFDSDVNKRPTIANRGMQPAKKGKHTTNYWHQQLPLSLSGIAASGTLPVFREAERIDGGYYWDGLYSQNPPVREFFAGSEKDERPDELWIIRINPQQWPEQPTTNSDIMDRQNELMGNLSLNKDLDFILAVNNWRESYRGKFAEEHKMVTVRSIKMKKQTADELRYSSKFNRSRSFLDQLRKEGHEVAQDWLAKWPNVGTYPEDAAY